MTEGAFCILYFFEGGGFRFEDSVCYNANIPTRRGDLWLVIGQKSRANT